MVREPSIRLGLELICRTRADALMGRLLRPRGVIFALHRVRPAAGAAFNPNRILEVTPEFLDETLTLVKSLGFRFITLDEVPDHLARTDGAPFACITLDDAYRDNKEHAHPVFARHRVPFTIFVPERFVDGTGQIWWVELELALAAASEVRAPWAGGEESVPCRTPAEKDRAFQAIYWHLRGLDEDAARSYTRRICCKAGVDTSKLCRDLIMTWDELRELARDPLASFGAHTSGHYALAKLPIDRARVEIESSKARLEHELGRPCRHFCFPYGDEGSAGAREFRLAAEAGFRTAVTMQKSLLATHHLETLTALPRCSLNGDYQDQRYVRALLSGAPFLVWQWVQSALPRLKGLARHPLSAASRGAP